MDFQSILLNQNLAVSERTYAAVNKVFNQIPENHEEATEQAVWFYCCGENPRATPVSERLLDWKVDYMSIWADFLLYCDIDIRRIGYLHWWEFYALFMSLPEGSAIKHRISIRSIDLSKIKDPDLREDYRRQKEIFALSSVEDDWENFYLKASK